MKCGTINNGRLIQMLGQDLDKPIAYKPGIDPDQFVKSHDLRTSMHGVFISSALSRFLGGAVPRACKIVRELASPDDIQ